MNKISLLLALASISMFAKTMYINDEKVDLIDPKTKANIGVIYEGTPVEIVKKEGKMTLIKVNGVPTQEDKKVMALTSDGLVTFLKLKDKDTMKGMEFLVPSDDLTDDQEEAWDEARQFYFDTCSSCHAAHKPKEHPMDEWDAYISAMQPNAKINDSEKAKIVRFVQAHANNSPLIKKK